MFVPQLNIQYDHSLMHAYVLDVIPTTLMENILLKDFYITLHKYLTFVPNLWL